MLLVDEATGVIQKSFHELGTRPQVATQIIKFMSSISRETLLRNGVNERITMVMETKRIFTKRNLIQQAQNECIAMKRNVEFFSNKFENLVKVGLPSAWDKDGKLLSYKNYIKGLFITIEKDDKFHNMTNTQRGQTIVIYSYMTSIFYGRQRTYSQILLHTKNTVSWILHSYI
jgi:hypothetical protein